MNDRRIVKHIINLELGAKLYWWEKLILFFLKMERVEGPAGFVEYKFFWNRLYIFKRNLPQLLPAPNPPTLTIPWDGGANTPWMN